MTEVIERSRGYKPPGVPGDLDSTGKALYRRLRAAMQERSGPTQWIETDHHLLSQACRYDQRARRARDGFHTNTDQMVTLGDRRQLTIHPLVKIAEQSERLFIDALGLLGFTPRERVRLGLEPTRPASESKFGF